jgi:hypothetical protein
MYRTLAAIALLALAAHTSAADPKLTVKVEDVAPPKELAEPVQALLSGKAMNVLDEKGKLICTIWPAKSLDAKATPFGAYDALLIDAVRNRWYDLLEDRNYASEGHGHVVIQFKLHSDGNVTEIATKDNTVSETLADCCSAAVAQDLKPRPPATLLSHVALIVGHRSGHEVV